MVVPAGRFRKSIPIIYTPHYGFKVHIATDAHEGFILGGHVTPANNADTSEFEKLVNDLDLDKETPVLADKGYSSQKNWEYLAGKKLTYGIMIQGARKNPLTEEEIGHNRLISRLCFIVEQGFGTFKRRYKFERARYWLRENGTGISFKHHGLQPENGHGYDHLMKTAPSQALSAWMRENKVEKSRGLI